MMNVPLPGGRQCQSSLGIHTPQIRPLQYCTTTCQKFDDTRYLYKVPVDSRIAGV